MPGSVTIRYYDFYGRPARITPGDADTPDICEVYDPARKHFVRRDDLTLDVYNSYGSLLIDQEDFMRLLDKAKNADGSRSRKE